MIKRKSDGSLWEKTKDNTLPCYSFTQVKNGITTRWLCVDKSDFEVVDEKNK